MTEEQKNATMHAVLVPREKLLATLRENRAKHADEYAAAHDGWEEARIAYLRETLAKAEAGEDFDIHFSGPEPREWLDDYDTAIAMLDWSQEEWIELSREEFQQYVLDEWKWKDVFRSTNVGYVGEHGKFPRSR
jgi:hypothetical protein